MRLLLIYSHSLVQIDPIRSQLETALDFLLVNTCMEECELIKGGHTLRLLVVKTTCILHLYCALFFIAS